ncbi:4-fold beta flower protein [Thermodesulfobacteriota bacterium]
MERSLFNKNGEAVAYISDDYHSTIYLWEGYPVAYLRDERQIYGINGRHLGWMINEIIFTNNGKRIGFTHKSCPVPPAKESIKPKKHTRDENRPRWEALPFPNLTFHFSEDDFSDFLKEGEPYNPLVASVKEEAAEEDV